MLRIFFVINVLLLGSRLPVVAQTLLSGRVTDRQGESLPGASVYIEGTTEGTTTNAEGRFSFVAGVSGTRQLVISFVGYRPQALTVELTGKPVSLEVQLAEAFNKLEDLVITAGSFSAGGEARREVLKPLDIVTTAGATADIAAALNTLPGTQTVGEQGRLFVRGGESYETRTYIDGLLVFRPYSVMPPNTPVRNRFSPFMFKGMSFSTGGYAAEYGQALSSTLDLNTKDRPEHTRTDLGLMSVGLEASQVLAGKHSALAAKLGYYNLGPYYRMVPQRIDWQQAPETFEVNTAWRAAASNGGMVKSYLKYATSRQAYQESPLPPDRQYRMAIANDYLYTNLSYRGALAGRWTTLAGGAFTLDRNRLDTDTSAVKQDFQGAHLKFTLARDLGSRLALHLGAEGIFRQADEQIELGKLSLPLRTFDENLAAAFAEADIYLTEKLITRLGLRFEGSNLSPAAAWLPRISLAWKTGANSQLSAAAGLYRQAPQDRYLLVNGDLGYETAEHFILNYQYNTDRRTLRAEVYYKLYHKLVRYRAGEEFNPGAYTNSGSGYARGFDLFWRDNRSIRNAEYWVSYSYIDTERDYQDFPHAAQPSFVANHNLSVVYKQFVPTLRTQFSGTYSFGSGRPYHDPNRSGFNTGRTPAYHDLSLSVSFLATPSLILHGSITNILGRDNIFGYEYARIPDSAGRYTGRAIKLPAVRMFFLGVFLTLSKDKNLNQMQTL